MDSGDVCTGHPPPDPGTACAGRLVDGLKQLEPDSNTPQHRWVAEAHQLGLFVHVWTIRNEVRLVYNLS